jgi:DNA-binding NarL/FixJ family response regulator
MEIFAAKRPRIVLADHSERALRMFNLLLCPYFEIVETVRDGEEALKAVARSKPDVLVLDIVLPLLDGIKIAQRLKDLGSATRVVFLTGHEEDKWIEAAMDAGARGFVFKKLALDDLPRAIQAALIGKIFVSSRE